MNTDIIIKTFIHHKYKTLLNLIVLILLSILIYSNLNLQSKQERLIFYFGFNNFANILTNDIGIRELNPINEFGRQIISYRNYILWTETLEDKPTWNYKNFLSFKFDEEKIVISNKINEKIINEIISYIEFTSYKVNVLFSSMMRLSAIKRQIDSNNAECNKKIVLSLDENIARFISKSIIKAEEFDYEIKKCLENEYNDNHLLEDQYTKIKNTVLTNQMISNNNSNLDDLELINVVEIFDIKREVVSINNLKAINIFTFTAFILIIGLILQYGLISFYYKNSSK